MYEIKTKEGIFIKKMKRWMTFGVLCDKNNINK